MVVIYHANFSKGLTDQDQFWLPKGEVLKFGQKIRSSHSQSFDIKIGKSMWVCMWDKFEDFLTNNCTYFNKSKFIWWNSIRPWLVLWDNRPSRFFIIRKPMQNFLLTYQKSWTAFGNSNFSKDSSWE